MLNISVNVGYQNMSKDATENVSEPTPVQNDSKTAKQDGGCVVFFQEKTLFGNRKPDYTEFVKHEEMYAALSESVDATHITGLQRINGTWRIYLDNVTDKANVNSKGLSLRVITLPFLQLSP